MGEKRKYGAITNTLTARVLKELYLFQENSLEEIARSYGCTRQMIDLLMDKYDIKRRGRISAIKLAKQKGKFRGIVKDKEPWVLVSTERRSEVRSPYPYAVEYTVNPGLPDENFRAMCGDISDSGLCLYLHNGLDAGHKISFKGGMAVNHSEATVRWCTRAAGNVFKVGLMFSQNNETRF
jgi:hypothetical protein